MTDHDGVTRWYTADPRGILPLETFHCPRTLRQFVKQNRYEIRINHDFVGTMRGCMSAPRDDTHSSWISNDLIDAYNKLHGLGFAHSVEAYLNDELVGGLYGVAMGGAFFGESMFHRATNASKVCLVHLVDRLITRGFELLDTQMVTDHMKQFGCIHISADEYLNRLDSALNKECVFE